MIQDVIFNDFLDDFRIKKSEKFNYIFHKKMDETEENFSMEEYTTDPNFRDIPTDIIPPTLERQLWKHQLQTIYKVLEAEGKPPIINNEGEVFYSRSGLIALSTGVGKTAAILGICNYDVEESRINSNISTSSLSVIKLNKKQRINIDVTIICASEAIINDAWIKDLNLYYPRLGYYKFSGIADFSRSVLNSYEYRQLVNDISQRKQNVENLFNSFETGQLSQEEFEILISQVYENFKDTDEKNYIIQEIEKRREESLKNLLHEKLFDILNLENVKIFFISNSYFYFLIDFFKKCTVNRLIIDEPQDLVITNQDFFRDYVVDSRLKKVKKINQKIRPYCEESPARFIWYVSATPERIIDNNDNHYFNSWVSRNDYALIDYSNSREDQRLFPELVNRYVIKFPYSYILESNPNLMNLIHEHIIEIKFNKENKILRGFLGEEIDEMLENNDIEGVKRKLNINSGIDNIFEMAKKRLEIEIFKHENKIRNYSEGTPEHIITQSREKLEEEKDNLRQLTFKIERYDRINQNQETCPICKDDLNVDDPENRCVCHAICMNGFHWKCIFDYISHLKKSNRQVTCPMCRKEILKIEDELFDMKNFDENNKVLTKRDISGIDNKMDALNICLGPMNRGGRLYERRKVLLFIQFSNDDNSTLVEIIKNCQLNGFNVRIPFNDGNKQKLLEKYPPINGCIVKNPGAKSSINNEINSFKNTNDRWVWIFRSAKEASGLNFEFVDTSIEYSPFRSHKQIIGRSIRMNRTEELDLFILKYV